VLKLRSAWNNGVENWEGLISELPGISEVSNGKDLRGFRDKHVYSIKGRAWADANLTGSKLYKPQFINADLSNTVFCNCEMEDAVFENVTFSFTDFRGATVSRSTFKGGVFKSAKLDGVVFGPDHDPRYDGSDSVTFEPRLIPLTWGRIRTLGKLPIFGISWAALAVSLTLIIFIGRINDSKAITIFKYPLDFPERVLVTLFSSLALVIGTTIFRLYCPREIQEFSEAEWVIQHRQPRLIYLSKASVYYPAQLLSSIGIGLGGLASIGLLIDRLIAAIKYLI